jgi:hypothetical protein
MAEYPEYKELVSEFRDQYEFCKKMAQDPEILSSYSIVIRWHPNIVSAGPNEKKAMQFVIASTPEAKHIVPSEKIDSYALVEESSCVVSYGSTLGIESAYMGKPSILIGLATYEALGSTHEPKNYSEFKKLVLNKPSALPIEGALVWGDWMKNRGEDFAFVKVNNQKYQINSRPVSARGLSSKARTIWFKCKHIIKFKIRSIKFPHL